MDSVLECGQMRAYYLLPLLLAATLATATEPTSQEPSFKVIGSANAPVTMDVFSDYECPHCRHLHDEALKMILANDVPKGKVRVILHDFPLSQHKYAREAAQYANAAGRIGQYQKVMDILFASQEEWGTGGSRAGDVDAVVARVLSPADMAKVRKMVKDPAIDAQINHDMQVASKIPLTETPTMVFHAKGKSYPVLGAVSYDILEKLIKTIS